MLDLATATEELTQIQTTMGLRSADAAKDLMGMKRVSDVITEAANKSQATIQQLADALTSKAGAAARAFGIPIEEVVAVLADFADQGVKGAKAGTAFSIVLRDLQTKAIKNADAFKHFGVSVFDSKGKMRDMADIVGDLEKALAGMSDKQKKATLMQMGFQDRSVGFILNLLGTSAAIRQYEADLKNASGATSSVAIAQLQSFSAGLALMWHMVTDVAIAIGEKLLPGLKNIALAVRDWLDVNETMIVSLMVGLLGAIGAVAGFIFRQLGPAFAFVGDKIHIAMGYVHDFVDAWDEVFGSHGHIATMSGKMKGLLEAITGPVGTLSGKMQGLLGILDEGSTKFNPIIGMLQALKEKFQFVASFVKPVVDKLQEFNAIGLILAGTITGILGGALLALIAWLLPFVASSAAVVLGVLALQMAWQAWGTDISGAVGQAIHWFATTVLPDLKKALDGISDWVSAHSGATLEFFGHLKDVGKTAFDTMVNAIQVAEPLLRHIAEVLLPAIGVAAGTMLTVINGTFTVIGDVWKWLGDRANDLHLKWDDLKGVVQGMTPVLDAFILLVTGALFLAFVGWIGQIGLTALGFSVKLTAAIVEFTVGPMVALIASIWGATGAFTALDLAAAPWILLIGGIAAIVVILASKLGSLQDWIASLGQVWGDVWNHIVGAVRDAAGLIVGIVGGVIDVVKTAVDWYNTFLGLAATADTLHHPHGVGGPALPSVPLPPGGAPPNFSGKMGGLAGGTPFWKGGLAMVGERGPELVNLPRGSNVYPNDQSAKMMKGGDQHVHLTVTGPLKVQNEYDVLRQLRRAATFLPIDARGATAHD